jgi:hypothetical protein
LLFLGDRRLLRETRDLVPNCAHLRFQLFRLLAPAALTADPLAEAFTIRVQFLQRGLRVPTLGIYAQDLVDLRCIIATAQREPFLHKLRLFANEADVEHGWELSARTRDCNRFSRGARQVQTELLVNETA